MGVSENRAIPANSHFNKKHDDRSLEYGIAYFQTSSVGRLIEFSQGKKLGNQMECIVFNQEVLG